jgi:hypothetical protein
MRPFVHQNRKAELARADQHDGENVSEWIGKQRNKRDRSEDDGPGMGDQRDAFPLPGIAQECKLGRREQIAGRDAALDCGGGHGRSPIAHDASKTRQHSGTQRRDGTQTRRVPR